MSPDANLAPQPGLDLPPQTDDPEVDAVMREVAQEVSASHLSVQARVAAATRAHQRLQTILATERD